MDAVELPLPTNLVVSKILPGDGFVREGKAEERGADGVDAPGFGRHKESGCGRSYGGMVFLPLEG